MMIYLDVQTQVSPKLLASFQPQSLNRKLFTRLEKIDWKIAAFLHWILGGPKFP